MIIQEKCAHTEGLMLMMKPSIIQVRGLGVEEGPEEDREKRAAVG